MSEEPNESPAGEDPKIIRLTKRLRAVHEAAGVPMPPEAALQGPALDLSKPIQEVVDDVLGLLQGRNVLFARGGQVGWVEEVSGAFRPMGKEDFVEWVPRVLKVAVIHGRNEKGVGRPKDLTAAKAAVILPALRNRAGVLPELRGVNQVRLPVLRSGGEIELLPIGYDTATGIYTCPGWEYDEGMDEEEARAVIWGPLHTFEFSDPNRQAVVVAGAVTMFCRHLYGGRAPMFHFGSNLPGAGKDALATWCVWATEGVPVTARFDPYARDDGPLDQILNSTALGGAPYVYFEDVKKGKLICNTLNQWLTQPGRTFTPKYENHTVSLPVRTVTLMTGCMVEFGNELGRRTLIADLFPTVAVEDRVLPEEAIVLDAAYFERREERLRQLAALWSLVRLWDRAGRPGGSKVLASFEGWSGVVPGVVATAALGDCLAKFEAPDGGDTETSQLNTLICEVVRRFGEDGWVASRDVVAVAREKELFYRILGTPEEMLEELECQRGFRFLTREADGVPTADEKRAQAASHLNQKQAAVWGSLLRRNAIDGRRFQVDGVWWQVGSRRKRTSRGYSLEVVSRTL